MEPEKPFACSMPDCGMTFTNEDHLHVHTKKHDMVLQLGMGQKAAFVADQTPTPTRFIRNCEEVGLFQDLQNVAVNPFDEGFKRAMETKHCMLTLEGPSSSEDVLHTPHLVFPLESGDCTLYTTNNQHNITISRSSSDDSGTVKEYETTKISKLTNEVTISRIVGKDDVSIVRHEDNTKNKDILNETSVSYTNNVIIHSNVEIRQDINIDTKKVSHNNDSVTKDQLLNMNDFVKFNDTNKLKEAPPIMSQKSLDFVVDSLTTESNNREEKVTKNFKRNNDNDKLQEKDGPKRNFDRKTKASHEKQNTTNLDNNCDFEVIVKLPNGKHFRMKAEDEVETPISAKEKLNNTIINKIQKPALKMEVCNPTLHNVVPICTGTLIPVTLINPNMTINQTLPVNHLMNQGLPVVQNMSRKIPIAPFSTTIKSFKSVKRKNINEIEITKAKDTKRKETEMNVNETGGCSVNKSKEPEINVNVRGGCSVNKSKELEANVNVSGGCSVNNSKELEINVNKKDGRLRTQRDTTDRNKQNLESRSAASRRYRERSKQTMQRQSEENKHLREMNRRLSNEKAVLQLIITEHLRDCPTGADLSCTIQEKLQDLNNF